MLKEGLFLMIIGMGVVFSFLTIMVVSMTITAEVIKILNKFFPEPTKSPIKAKASNGAEQEIAVAIAAVQNAKK